MDKRLAKRPTFQGMPIPYVQQIRSDGTPDFKVVNEERVHECIDRGRCGLCGEGLTYWIALVGGPLCVKNRAYLEPPMHVECAQDAFGICPYLFKGKDFAEHIKDDPAFEGEYRALPVEEGRPERMSIYVTRAYTSRVEGGARVIKPEKYKRVEWYDMQGQLIETTEA